MRADSQGRFRAPPRNNQGSALKASSETSKEDPIQITEQSKIQIT